MWLTHTPLYHPPSHILLLYRHIKDLAEKLGMPPMLQIKQKKGHIERSKALGIPQATAGGVNTHVGIERRKICA